MTYRDYFDAFYAGPYAEHDATRERVLASMTPAERIAWNLLADITDRRGWAQEWDGMDEDIQDKIFKQFVIIIDTELNART